MSFRQYDCVAAICDFPEHGIRSGDLGAIVEIYEGGACEVEFIEPNGHTKALFAGEPHLLREAAADELRQMRLAVEPEITER